MAEKKKIQEKIIRKLEASWISLENDSVPVFFSNIQNVSLSLLFCFGINMIKKKGSAGWEGCVYFSGGREEKKKKR